MRSNHDKQATATAMLIRLPGQLFLFDAKWLVSVG
jgi:hypothetical protein